MNILITDHCRIKYWQNPILITKKILSKIPDKFLEGLDEIIFYDKTNNPVITHLKKSGKTKIEIYMGGFTNGKRYSVFHFNLVFLSKLSDYIVTEIQPKSTDPDIKSVRPSRFNPKWMYLGWSFPILVPLNMLMFVYDRSNSFRNWFKRKHNNFTKEIPKNT